MPFILNAQHELEAYQLKIGFGYSHFKTKTETTITAGPISLTVNDTINTKSTVIPFSFMAGIRDWWSMGLYGRIGQYSIDTAKTSEKGDKIYSFGLNSDIYFVNTPMLNMYINAGSHFTYMTVFEETFFDSWQYRYVGWGPTANIGANIFIIPVLGFNVNIGYEGQFLFLNERLKNGNAQSMDNIRQKMNSNGLHLNAGLNLMF